MPLRYRMSPLFWFSKPQSIKAADLVATTRGIIILRLTVNGKRTDISTGVRCMYKEWDSDAQKIRGVSTAAKQGNAKLTGMLDDANGHYLALERAKLPITADRLKQLMADDGMPADESLLNAWDAWGKQQQRRLEAGEIAPYTAGLATQRRPLVKRWLEFIKRPGLLSRELTPALVRDFRLWLLSPAVPSVSSADYASKTARLLAECCAYAVERGALPFHPCPKLKLPTPKPTVLHYLTPEQLCKLISLVGLSSQLQRVRDGFLLQCYTGLAWADARLVRQHDVSAPDHKGVRWLRVPRQKTGTLSLIPLLPEADLLFQKYYPSQVPVCSNQLYNANLKLLGERLKLSFPLTSHIGRKTFAMQAAERGVSLDVIGSMLGHVNLKHTHVYAKIQQDRVGREMRDAGLL